MEDTENEAPSMDAERVEQPWEERAEDLLKTWEAFALKQGGLHYRAAKKAKCMFTVFGLPSMLLPIMTSVLSPFVTDPFFITVMMLTAGVVSGIATFFDFGRKRADHLRYEALFSAYAIDIQMIMAKPKRHREACDVVMEREKMTLKQLSGGAPPM